MQLIRSTLDYHAEIESGAHVISLSFLRELLIIPSSTWQPLYQFPSSPNRSLPTTRRVLFSEEIIETFEMEFGAAVAYKRIDEKVEKTLKAAAEMLKGVEKNHEVEYGRKDNKVKSIEHKSVTVTSCSLSSVTSGNQPKATIRTPIDARKHRKLYFPTATITSKNTFPESPSSFSTDPSSFDTVTTTPDSLFPSAIYIPARKSQIQISPFPRSRSSSAETASAQRSAHRKYIEKLATEPLEDIKHLKCRGQKKSKPDSMFPQATYKPGSGKPKLALSPTSGSSAVSSSSYSSTDYSRSSASDASSLVYQPMEFVSKDGRVKMLLQPLESQDDPKLKLSNKASPNDVVDFPIVPKQLESSHNLKIGRTKFSTKLSIGDKTIDLSGIFSGNSMKTADLAKLVINGQSYSL